MVLHFSRPVPHDEVDFSWMVGRRLTAVTFLRPSPWRFDLGDDGARIDVECLWRITGAPAVEEAPRAPRGYESWHVFAPDGRGSTATGGAQIVEWARGSG